MYIIYIYACTYMYASRWQCNDACIQTCMCRVMSIDETFVMRLSILPWILDWDVKTVCPFLLARVFSFPVTPIAMFHLLHHYPPTLSGLIRESVYEQLFCWLLFNFSIISLSAVLNVLQTYFPNWFSKPEKVWRGSVHEPQLSKLSNLLVSHCVHSFSLAGEHFKRGSWDLLPNFFHYKFVFIFVSLL